MNRFLLGLILISVLSAPIFADDKGSYCESVIETASAQRDLLRTPNAITGVTQPNTGLPAQTVVGLSTDLSSIRKASLTMRAAKSECALYNSTIDAQQRIIYALPSIEKEVLHHRLDLIQAASDKLDQLIASNLLIVSAGNLTKPAVHVLQNAKIRLDSSRDAALTGIVSPYVPPLGTSKPLRLLVLDKLADEQTNQRASAQLAKQSSWDVQVSAGARRQISSLAANTSAVGAYGEVSVTYNLARHSADRHLDNAVRAYTDWKATQFDDVAQQARVLKQQMVDTLEIQNQQLAILGQHAAEIESNLQSLQGVDTAAGIAFRNELLADQLVLSVDIGDVQFRISRLQDYLRENF